MKLMPRMHPAGYPVDDPLAEASPLTPGKRLAAHPSEFLASGIIASQDTGSTKERANRVFELILDGLVNGRLLLRQCRQLCSFERIQILLTAVTPPPQRVWAGPSMRDELSLLLLPQHLALHFALDEKSLLLNVFDAIVVGCELSTPKLLLSTKNVKDNEQERIWPRESKHTIIPVTALLRGFVQARPHQGSYQ
jgi:hypothetical protein